jgi:hypothetical protein
MKIILENIKKIETQLNNIKPQIQIEMLKQKPKIGLF